MSSSPRLSNPAFWLVFCALACATESTRAADPREAFFEQHCTECHDPDSREGDLDLTSLPSDFKNHETFNRWVKVYDRIHDGLMPPKKKAPARPRTGPAGA